jgi:predicted dehydrogenase
MAIKKIFRVGVIGASGKGDYGHGIDVTFAGLERAKIVAVADEQPAGLQKAAERLGVDRRYADFRKMLENEKLDIVCVGPRWLDDRVAMVSAAADAGAHVYCEKPFASDLVMADAMSAACRRRHVKLAMAHQWRAMPPVQQAIRHVREGKYGKLLRVIARPKDDSRGGGEELLVHGTHLFDMMLAFAGTPHWVSGHVLVGDRSATLADRRSGTEPIGPIAGDSISAMFGFSNGVRGYFESTAHLSKRGNKDFDNLYGLTLECQQARLQIRQPGDVYVYPAPCVLPDLEKLEWEKQWLEAWHFTPEHKPRSIRSQWLRLGNTYLANNLMDAIEQDQEPLSGLQHAQWITEMVQGVYASHLSAGKRLEIPLAHRAHPLLPA